MLLALLMVLAAQAAVGQPAARPQTAAATLVSYQTHIQPVFRASCMLKLCHDGTVRPDLSNYQEVSLYAKRISKRLQNKLIPMPPTDAPRQLTALEKSQILLWIQSGTPNN